jgi:hypothetical protein
MKDQTRNLNPHKPAVAAMFIYGAEYSRQGGGSMDFWDQLSDHRKNVCRRLVKKIEDAVPEEGDEP